MNLGSLFTRQNDNPASDGFNFLGPREPAPRAPRAESKLGQLAAGVYNGAVAPLMDFMGSPEGLATAALPGLPAMAQKGVAALFAPVAFRNMEEARQRANEVAADPNASLQDRVTPIADAVSQGLMGIGAARHAIPKPNLGRLDITAWHGTPHEVDRFSMDKIGTGEGAQSYGHGLYFAESPATAEYYRDKLAPAGIPFVDRVMAVPGHNIPSEALTFLHGYEGVQPAIEGLRATATSDSPMIKNAWAGREQQLAALNQKYLSAADWLEQNQNRLELQPSNKNLYKVDLAPNHEDFLHWDKPLSEQSPQVQAALAKLPSEAWGGINEELDSRMMATLGDTPWAESDFSGRDLYQSLIRNREGLPAHPAEYDREVAPPELVSHILNQAGLPGIAYLDQGSRTSGQGTHNYVMFDDKGIKILEKNGQPVASLFQQ